jgi:hypothetical protein
MSLSLSLILRLTVSRPVCLGIKHPSGAYEQIFIIVRQLRVCDVGALSDEKMGLTFTIAAGPRQRSHSRVRVPWDLRSYFTVLDSRLPFSSPPTTRRAMVEVFDPASTRDICVSSVSHSLKRVLRELNRKHLVSGFGCRAND